MCQCINNVNNNEIVITKQQVFSGLLFEHEFLQVSNGVLNAYTKYKSTRICDNSVGHKIKHNITILIVNGVLLREIKVEQHKEVK